MKSEEGKRESAGSKENGETVIERKRKKRGVWVRGGRKKCREERREET